MYKGQNNNSAIAILFVLVLVLAVFVTAACTNGFTDGNPYGWFDKKDAQTVDGAATNKMLEVKEVSTSTNIRLLSTSGAVSASDETTMSQTIQATIVGDDADSAKIDWAVYWADDDKMIDNGADINNYLILTPESDGATTATRTCVRSFPGSTAYVKATIRYTNSFATCKVTCVGFPDHLDIDASSLDTSSTWNPVVILESGKTYRFPLYFYNTIGEVSNYYYNNLKLWIYPITQYTFFQREIIIDGVSQSKKMITASNIDDYNMILQEIYSECFECSIVDHQLIVKVNCKPSNYYKETTKGRTTTIISAMDPTSLGFESGTEDKEFQFDLAFYETDGSMQSTDPKYHYWNTLVVHFS